MRYVMVVWNDKQHTVEIRDGTSDELLYRDSYQPSAGERQRVAERLHLVICDRAYHVAASQQIGQRPAI